MAALDNIASELLKSANEADLIYKRTRDQAQRDKAVRLRRIVENLRQLVFGASDLNGLSDVTLSAPANGQVLTYNSTTNQWENQTPGGGGGGGDMYKSTYDVDNDGIVDGSETTQIIVRNSTGSTLTKGQVVYLSGATGNRPNAVLSQANTEATSSKTIGIVVANIANNSDGYVAVNGTLHNLDTSAFADGTALWLSATTAGAYTSTIPAEPNHTVFIGYVARSHPTQGRLVILIQNGYELNELHGVLISAEANNDLLTYESSTGLWKNKTISTIFGGTPLVSVPTLAQVTTAGNTTTNAITVGGLVVDTNTLVVDSVNNRVGIGTTTPAYNLQIIDTTSGVPQQLDIRNTISAARAAFTLTNDLGNSFYMQIAGSSYVASSLQNIPAIASQGTTVPAFMIATNWESSTGGSTEIRFVTGGYNNTPTMTITAGSTGNVLIGTTTNAGYKLDVNGTARVSGNLTLGAEVFGPINTYFNGPTVNTGTLWLRFNAVNSNGNFTASGVVQGSVVTASGTHSVLSSIGGGVQGVIISNTTTLTDWRIEGHRTTSGALEFKNDLTNPVLNLFSSRNVGIGTFTDAGYKLDVNGTARVATNLTVSTAASGAMNTYLGGSVAIGNDFVNNGYILQIKSLNTGIAGIYLRAGGAGGYPILLCQDANGTASTTFIVKETGNVGVGTTTPTYKLQVIGSTYNTFSTTAPFLVDTSANNYRIGNLINNSGYNTGGFANNTFDIFSVGANSSSSSNASQFFRININGGNSSGAYGASGNNVTLAQLNAVTNSILYITAQGSGGYIQGSTSSGLTVSTLTFGENLSLRSDMGSGFGGGGINYYASINGANHSHRWFTTLTEHMRLTSGGNLLIGTTTDAGYKLDVNGTGRFVNTLNLDSNLTFGANDITINSTKVFGKLSIYGTASAVSAIAIGYTSTASNNSSVSIGYNSQNSGDRAVTIGADTSSSATNSVTIGRGSVGATDSFVSGSNLGTIADVYFGSGVRHASANTAGADYRINGSGASNNFNIAGGNIIIAGGKGTGTGTPGDVIFATSSILGSSLTLQSLTNRVWIKGDSGNVGIGTSNPLYKLHVTDSAGDIVYILASTGQSAIIGATGSGTNRMYIGYSPGAENISITSSGVVRLNSITSGNVLIGTTTDAGYKLDVNGTGRFTNNLSINKSYNLTWGTNQQINVTDYPSYFSGGYNVMSFISTSSGSYADDGSFVWRNAGTSSNLMVLTGVGNLGLGTSNPTDKIHIVDNTNGNKFGRISAGGTNASAAWVAQNDQVDNVVYRVFGSAVTGSQMGQALARSASLIANLGGTGKFLIGSFSGTDLIFGTSDQARMRLVDATGNFLIGTMTDTGNKLTVSGDIDAQGYKVNNVLGYTGILNIPTNPPGQQNIDIQGGIVINIF